MNLIYSGKAKDIFSTDNEHQVIARYKDQVTMLNGAVNERMAGKGRLNNLISSLIFKHLNQAGFATHFVERLSEAEQLTEKVTIIPIEVVCRNLAAGSFSKRFGLDEGLTLKQPLIEFYYKKDELDDPFVNDEHLLELGIATQEDLTYLKEETRKINDFLRQLFAKIDLTLVDFKLEFGRDSQGRIILADEISPDTCRLWDTEGNHLDKDVFRRQLGSLVEVYSLVLEKLEEIEGV